MLFTNMNVLEYLMYITAREQGMRQSGRNVYWRKSWN